MWNFYAILNLHLQLLLYHPAQSNCQRLLAIFMGISTPSNKHVILQSISHCGWMSNKSSIILNHQRPVSLSMLLIKNNHWYYLLPVYHKTMHGCRCQHVHYKCSGGVWTVPWADITLILKCKPVKPVGEWDILNTNLSCWSTGALIPERPRTSTQVFSVTDTRRPLRLRLGRALLGVRQGLQTTVYGF